MFWTQVLMPELSPDSFEVSLKVEAEKIKRALHSLGAHGLCLVPWAVPGLKSRCMLPWSSYTLKTNLMYPEPHCILYPSSQSLPPEPYFSGEQRSTETGADHLFPTPSSPSSALPSSGTSTFQLSLEFLGFTPSPSLWNPLTGVPSPLACPVPIVLEKEARMLASRSSSARTQPFPSHSDSSMLFGYRLEWHFLWVTVPMNQSWVPS